MVRGSILSKRFARRAAHPLTLLLIFPLVAMSTSEPVPLFDGKSFHGWEGDTVKSFRIQNGAIVGGTLQEKIPHNEFLCTEKSYSNFELRLKFKVIGANAGVQIRSRRVPRHYEVKGYQADLGDPEWWGCLYDESRRNKVLAKSNMAEVNTVLKRDDWNEYRIRCEGKRIQLWINGYQTVDYIEQEEALEQSGIIGLQIHGGQPSEAWYRDITIEELP
jgi:Domain of Unknown Function (DUF1080)